MAGAVPFDSDNDWLIVGPACVALAAIGYAVGICWPHLLTGIFKVTPVNEQGLAAASITTVQLFATAFGAALAGLIVNLAGLSEPGGITGTASAARWLFGCLLVVPLIVFATARRLGRPSFHEETNRANSATTPA